MELSQDMIIDLTINIVGYILAGCLSVLIYSSFNREKKVAKVTAESKPILPTIEKQPEVAPVAVSQAREVVRQAIEDVKNSPVNSSDGQFLRFGQPGQGRNSVRTAENKPSSRVAAYGKRDREQIIRVATEMLKAGASTDKIKGVIPVTDAELALLSFANLN